MMVRVFAVFAVVCGLGCSSTQAGDSCPGSTGSCGGNLTCISCNSDAGTDEPTCHVVCQTDSDCNGTSDVFGATPKCDSDLCGNHFCGPGSL
jgi:hypothetical protein